MKLFYTSLLAILFFSCGDFTKANYISSYEKFVNDASEHYATYSDKERQEADLKFKKYSEEDLLKYKADLSPEEKAHINQLTGKYYAIVAKQKAGQISDELKDVMQKAKGVLDEIAK